jgi:dipeptidyl aminopeptidase/acylaminoacyl peptidase
MTKQRKQFGMWPSPISPRSLSANLRLNDVQWDTDGDADTLVWHESRAKQGVLVMQPGLQAPRDLTTELSVRGGVGYGGGAFTVAGGTVYFVASGRLYKQSLSGGGARAITPAFGDVASPAVSKDGRWLVYVHAYEGADILALVDTAGEHWPRKLASGTDFVMQPTWNPNGTRLAYIAWNFPQMPWDGTELRLATLDSNGGLPRVTLLQTVAGNTKTAIFQPEFSPDGLLLAYVSDASGWPHLYVYDLSSGTHTQLTEGDASYSTPAWVQGLRTYGWSHDSRAIYAIRSERAFSSLWRIDVKTRRAEQVEGLDAYTTFDQIAVSPRREEVALIASSSVIPERIITIDSATLNVPPLLSAEQPGMQVIVDEPRGEIVRRRASAESVAPEQLAQAEAIEWTAHDGETAHGLYYPPTSAKFEGIGAPPLIVFVHGGPVSQARAGFSNAAQFFATRGYAMLYVNHRGSTGYGKAYQDKLLGNWGVYDVEDSASGASALVERGWVDGAKLVIMGSSAGGFTALQSLVTKPGFYAAGVCSYGISNQFMLVTDTEFKFESRSSDMLLGPLPDAVAVYRARSPLFHADKIVDPVAIFQGEDDKIVPKAQSDALVKVLQARGVPHEYHVYAGEGHGWRKPETIEAYYRVVLSFLRTYVIYG